MAARVVVLLCCVFVISSLPAPISAEAPRKGVAQLEHPQTHVDSELSRLHEPESPEEAQVPIALAAEERAAKNRLRARKPSRPAGSRGLLGLWRRTPLAVRVLINLAVIAAIVATVSKTRQVKKGCQTCVFKPKKKPATKAGAVTPGLSPPHTGRQL